MNIRSIVAQVPAADPSRALTHFQSRFTFETDCWDVHYAQTHGHDDFVLLDVRGPELFARGHVPGATHLPQREITEERMAEYADGTLFVVYCAGPHCNAAQRAALRLARLGRPVKEMIGGIEGWKDEGFDLESA